jgi:hypothetical protein
MLPGFVKGWWHTNSVGISRCAKDGKDYEMYYVGQYALYSEWYANLKRLTLHQIFRFSDRDLMMHYHWGLGVGHQHAHQATSTFHHKVEREDEILDSNLDEGLPDGEKQIQDGDTQSYDPDHPEFDLDDCEAEGWEDVESESSDGENGSYSGCDSDIDIEDGD